MQSAARQLRSLKVRHKYEILNSQPSLRSSANDQSTVGTHGYKGIMGRRTHLAEGLTSQATHHPKRMLSRNVLHQAGAEL